MTASAAMVALSVVLTRYVGFAPEGTPFRFEIGFLPIAFVGYLFGPFYSAVSYTVADLIGSLLSGYAPYLPITLMQTLTGAVFGFCFYRRKPTLLRISLTFTAIAAVIDILAKAPILSTLYGWEIGSTLLLRLYNALVNLPIRIVLFYFSARAMKKPLKKIFGKEKMKDFKDYANSFQAVTVPGLERISALTRKLGSPEEGLRFIHIAGTNGKGSTSACMAAILEDAGYTVGKYISPNLIKVNERISVSGEDIPDSDLERILSMIEPLSKEVQGELGIAPTQFEIWTAAAFVYFKERKCDFVVLEVGLGGELDATNVIKTNVIEIITRLGIDHKQYLGDTIESVASAKAGIIKERNETSATVTCSQDPSAMKVILDKCESLGKECIVPEPKPIASEGVCERFYLEGVGEILCGIPGYHQIENASLAAAAALRMSISPEHIKSGIARAQNPARFELIRKDPDVIYDGGHNENGITALNKSLERYYHGCPKTVVFACMADKEIKESLSLLSQGVTEFIFTTVKDNPRAESAKGLQKKAEGFGFFGEAYEDIGEAYEAAIKKNRLTVICGSLYLYKDLREFLDNNKTRKEMRK